MIEKVLVATDGSLHARKAVEYASDIAAKYDATLYLVHVVPETEIPEEVLEYIRVEGIEDPPESVYLEKVGRGIIEVAEEEARAKGVKRVEPVVLQGDPAETIIELARSKGVDMVVTGSRGLGGVKGLLLGSVSSKICHLADCTCVTVK